jgi:hypothetical protein
LLLQKFPLMMCCRKCVRDFKHFSPMLGFDGVIQDLFRRRGDNPEIPAVDPSEKESRWRLTESGVNMMGAVTRFGFRRWRSSSGMSCERSGCLDCKISFEN